MTASRRARTDALVIALALGALPGGCDQEPAVGAGAPPERRAAERPAGAAAAAASTWSEQQVVDFGEIHRMPESAKASWTIRNPRASVRHLTGLVKSCGCQQVVLVHGPDKGGAQGRIETPLSQAGFRIPVQPGEECTVRIELDPMRLGSHANGEIMLVTDDPLQPTISVRFRGRVKELLRIEPPVHEIGEVRPGQARTAWLESTVRRTDGKPLRITDIRQCPEGLFADYQAVSVDRKTWKVRVRVIGLRTEGPLHARVKFVTEECGIGLVRIIGHVRESVRFRPAASLILGVIHPGHEKSAELLVESDPSRPLGDVQAAWQSLGPARVTARSTVERLEPTRVRVRVTIAADTNSPEAMLRGRLRVRVAPAGPVRTLEVYGFVRPRRAWEGRESK